MNAYEATVTVHAADIGHGGLSAIRDGIESAMLGLEDAEQARVEIVSANEIRVTVDAPHPWGDNVRELVREAIEADLRGVLDGEAGERVEVSPFVDAEPTAGPRP